MNLHQGQIKLLELVNKAYNGEVMLPDFQRNFVWARHDIEELIKSLLEDVFIGTFLILETNPSNTPFKTIFVQGAEQVNQNIQVNPHILILDGQQRLTSLFYTIYSPDIPLKNTETPYAFFIDLNKLATNNLDEAVFSWSKKWREYRLVVDSDGKPDYPKLMEKKLLPLTIFSDSDKFYDLWHSEYKKLFDEDEAKKIKKYLENVLDYHILTLTLGSSYNDKPEEIAALFEKINRTGIKLSPYDLLVARLYKFIRLREEWEMVFNEKPNIKRLASRVDNTNIPYSFIQALVLSNDKSIKSKDLIKIDDTLLNKDEWDRVVDLVENKVLPRILNINKYGIADIEKWLPYRPIITLMIAFYLKHNHPDVDKMDMWYWGSVFSERYSGSTETMMMRDFRAVSNWFSDDNKIPEVVEQLRVQLSTGAYSLRDVKRRGSSKYKGVFNLLFKNEAKDFYQPEDISYNELEDHHIFPRKFLEAKNVNVDYDTVLNRTLIFNSTNRKISNKSPAEYIEEMINIQKSKGLPGRDAENKVKDILKAHFIDERMYEILKNTHNGLLPEEISKNFEEFVIKREELITKKISELIGLGFNEDVPQT